MLYDFRYRPPMRQEHEQENHDDTLNGTQSVVEEPLDGQNMPKGSKEDPSFLESIKIFAFGYSREKLINRVFSPNRIKPATKASSRLVNMLLAIDSIIF